MKVLTDMQDIAFTLFKVLKIQRWKEDYGEEECLQILEEYKKFAEQKIYPTRQLCDHEGVQLTPQGVKVPICLQEVKSGYYENGWFQLGLEEKWGGIPVPEALFAACTSIGNGANVSWMMYPGLSRGVVNTILRVATEEQKQRYIPPMMDGQWGGTMCLTEPGAGSDVGSLVTTARPLGNGKYAIKGIKIFITSGENDLYDNIIHLVLARTPQAASGIKGISLFIVPRYKLDASGKTTNQSNHVRCTKIEEKMGIHGSATCELNFGDSGECVGELLGLEGEGINNMFIMMNEARIMCATQGEGQSLLSYQLAYAYAQERVQFQQPIIQHPDVNRMLLKMRATARGLRGLLLYTSDLMDGAKYLPQDQAKTAHLEVELLTPICKAYATEKGVEVAIEGVQIHGGYGYCSEYGMEQFIRDIKIATIYEGTNGIQAKDFTMRKILRDKGLTLINFVKKIETSLKGMSPEEEQCFQREKKLLQKYTQQVPLMLEKFWPQITQKQFDELLFKSYDFLFYIGHIAVAWRLLEAARVALPLKDKNQEFYHSKVTDVKIFCQLTLQQNESLGAFILGEMVPL